MAKSIIFPLVQARKSSALRIHVLFILQSDGFKGSNTVACRGHVQCYHRPPRCIVVRAMLDVTSRTEQYTEAFVP